MIPLAQVGELRLDELASVPVFKSVVGLLNQERSMVMYHVGCRSVEWVNGLLSVPMSGAIGAGYFWIWHN